MIYGSWDIKQNRQFFFSLWAIFCLFTPLTTQKINILKKGKIYLEISFYTSVPNHNQMLHCSWDMACNRLIVIFHFGLLFALLFLEQPKKSKFWKSEKNARRYHHFTHIIINLPKTKQKMLWVVTIAMTRSTLASLWKFQYFRRPVYNPVEHLWWGFYCQNSKQLSIFTKKLHHRCSLRF